MRITILFLCMIISVSLFSQEYLYKKDGNILIVKDVLIIQNTISYKLFNDSNQFINYISITAIDSIAFQNGVVTKFESSLYPINEKTLAVITNSETSAGKNYKKPNVNYANTFYIDPNILLTYRKLRVGYEYMVIKQRVGLTLSFSFNIEKKRFDDNYFQQTGEFYTLKELIRDAKYGLTASLSYYVTSSGFFNTGIKASFNFVESVFYNYESLVTRSAYYNSYGLGLFAKINVTSRFTPLISTDFFYTKDHEETEFYFIPQIVLGFSF